MMESIDFIRISIASYLAIGVFLATVGPAGKVISDEVKRVSNPLLYAVNDQPPPSKNKILLLRVLLTIGMILLWSILIWGVLKELKFQSEIEKDHIEKSVGLWFQRMGGCGSIHCQDCQHSEKVTSFIHGIDISHSGFQCQSCGKITSLTGGGRGKANQYKESLICDCGGKLDRDKVIFCPQCRSKNLAYFMEFIT
jgi:hypothetical protein